MSWGTREQVAFLSVWVGGCIAGEMNPWSIDGAIISLLAIFISAAAHHLILGSSAQSQAEAEKQ